MEQKKEFGDFQTPQLLVDEITSILASKDIAPEIMIEPTCGMGSILLTVNEIFKPYKSLGIELQGSYVEKLSKIVKPNTTIINKDFFKSINFIQDYIGDFENLLFVGNPPWVTNSELAANLSKNLPMKTNIDNVKGISAITGKSNFDISEYIIRELISNFSNKKSIFAFLCKTSVAKKIVGKLCKDHFKYKSAELYPIDSKKYFNAAVDACFFYLDCTEKFEKTELLLFDSIEKRNEMYKSGYVNGVYLEDLRKSKCLEIYGKSSFVWRNGIKHDCTKVMEFKITDGKMYNGYAETVNIEPDLVFPYLKSSDIANGKLKPLKRILITQKYINESTLYIEKKLPKTWDYLIEHSKDFEKRKSIIYKNKFCFSIFSVGDYSFKPYKIAISGLYKKIAFQLIEPFDGKTVLLDDTCNFISFDAKEKALFIYNLLNTEIVKDYLTARISWESKRPIKTEILNSINLEKVAEKMNLKDSYFRVLGIVQQSLLFG